MEWDVDLPAELTEQVGTINKIVFPRQGHTSVVAILDTPERKYAVKKTVDKLYNTWLAEEHYALKLLSSTDLLVPQVYAYHVGDGVGWLLMDYMDGVSLRTFLAQGPSPERKEQVLANYGSCLRSIHETPCPAALKKDGQPWLDTMLAKAEYNLKHHGVDGTSELLKRLKQKRPSPVAGTFIHGDFTIDNVLVNDCKIAGIIDWAGAAFGDPRYDVALAIRPKLNAFDYPRDREVFFEAYGKSHLTEEEYHYFEEGLYQFF